MPKHEIVILGGHFAGVGTAHYILRHVIPSLTKLTSKSYHVTLVSPSTHFFFNPATPRALVNANLIPTREIFLPLADGFKEYKAGRYTIVQGKAVALNPTAQTVTLALESGDSRVLAYGTLVLATGRTSTSPLWTVNGPHTTTIDALSNLHSKLPQAKTLLVAGGGPTGVETAGELATHYPQAKITLLSGGSKLLPGLLPANSKNAQTKLTALGVKVVHELRVSSATPSEGEKATTLALSDGSSTTVDIYIDATGGVMNTGFLPAEWLTSKGQVETDPVTLRPTASGMDHVYAIGDIATYSDGGIMAGVNAAVPVVATAIGVDLAKAAGKTYPGGQKPYKPMKDTQLVSTGPKGGVGQLSGHKVPSLMVWAIKSRNFLLPLAKSTTVGKEFIKG
jgi:NADH dehydrogenase FAD-containing subunit